MMLVYGTQFYSNKRTLQSITRMARCSYKSFTSMYVIGPQTRW